MKDVVLKLVCCCVLTISLCFFSCSIGPDGIAGGAGAGNPATLSVIADGADSTFLRGIKNFQAGFTPDFQPLTKFTSFPMDTGDTISITIVDFGKMHINVNGVFITTRYASFPLPESVNVDDIEEPLYCDSNTIFLDGPFIFDVLRGTSVPQTSFNLPNGLYKYANLYIGPDDTSGMINKSFIEFQIVITGKFTYLDTLRNISIYILCNEERIFHAADSGVELTGEDSVDLIIGLDEQGWLDSINIKGCLNNGVVYLDEHGNLSIYDNPSGTGPDAQLAARIRYNIFRSGVFRHRHPK